ncbi:MAG: SCO family protein, partial [Deltaproteobacteria bacterium]|nr:SCO family protein [Deltaproteobacteria bacterium]
LENFKGKVWVANFVFTSCAGTCPLLTQRMKKFDEDLSAFKKEHPEADIAIVSFTVDPDRDTPEKLKAYRKEYDIHSPYWTFLTGDTELVTKVVVQGFKISMSKVEKEISDFDVIHGEKFVLVDQEGRIRGYYDSDNRGRKELFRDFKKLIQS